MRYATTLQEKYRPRRLEQIRGHDAQVSAVRSIMDAPGFDGCAFWIDGATGTGKTCFAHAMAHRLDVRRSAWNYEEIDGQHCSLEVVRGLDAQAVCASLFSDVWRVFVVNEAHRMKHDAAAAWLTLLERLPYRWLVVFTTMHADAPTLFKLTGKALVDRCIHLRLSSQGLAPVFARLGRAIARREGLNGQSLKTYENALRRGGVRNSMRALLQRIQARDFCTDREV